MQFWQTDVDFDHKTDQMNFQLTFKPPIGYALNNFNLFLELDAQLRVSMPHVHDDHHCMNIQFFSFP